MPDTKKVREIQARQESSHAGLENQILQHGSRGEEGRSLVSRAEKCFSSQSKAAGVYPAVSWGSGRGNGTGCHGPLSPWTDSCFETFSGLSRQDLRSGRCSGKANSGSHLLQHHFTQLSLEKQLRTLWATRAKKLGQFHLAE